MSEEGRYENFIKWREDKIEELVTAGFTKEQAEILFFNFAEASQGLFNQDKSNPRAELDKMVSRFSRIDNSK